MKVLIYDGSYPGFLTAVYDAFYLRSSQVQLLSASNELPLLFETVQVNTDEGKSRKVGDAVSQKLSPDCAELIYRAWLSHLPEMDNWILRFLKRSFRAKRDISDMLQDEAVSTVVKASGAVGRELQRMYGILRFQKIGAWYVADIEPDYELLPLLAPHFADRFGSSDFVIRDLHYHQALFYTKGKMAIVPMETFTDLTPYAQGLDFEEAWKAYYRHMTIPERRNLRLMQQFIPKKYWKHILERQ